MDKRFKDIGDSIKKQAPAFMEYLRIFVLDDFTYRLLLDISSQTNVYIFSGVIRNYLLGESNTRDIDIVVCNLDKLVFPVDVVNKYKLSRNSYGGIKATVDDLVIDIWDIKNTWTLLQRPSMKPTPHTLIETAFFNFSAIVYDIRRRAFVFGRDFMEFYLDKEIDVVNQLNPNIALCIVNTMYYAIKLECPVRYKLCKWIVDHYRSDYPYEQVQLSHFHRLMFTTGDIERFGSVCEEMLPTLKKHPHSHALKISDNR